MWFVLNDQYWTSYYQKLNAMGRTSGTLAGGAVVKRTLDLGGKQVPLPPGNWVVLADRASDLHEKRFGAFGYIRWWCWPASMRDASMR